jgi:hypothetical protein
VDIPKISDIATLEGWYEAYKLLRKKNSGGISGDQEDYCQEKEMSEQ